jgi:hypothetical protein
MAAGSGVDPTTIDVHNDEFLDLTDKEQASAVYTED